MALAGIVDDLISGHTILTASMTACCFLHAADCMTFCYRFLWTLECNCSDSCAAWSWHCWIHSRFQWQNPAVLMEIVEAVLKYQTTTLILLTL